MRFVILFILLLLLFPFSFAADIEGYVIDEQQNLVRHAPLRISCAHNTTTLPSATDGVGFFAFSMHGTCRIIAIHGQRMGEVTVSAEDAAQTHFVEVVVRSSSFSSLYIFLLVVLAGIFVTVFLFRRSLIDFFRGRSFSSSATPALSSTVLQTLVANERLVVEQLQLHGPLTQSQLRHYTSLPKSTLHRLLVRLEQRSIVITKECAGVKRVHLTGLVKT